VLTIFSQVGIPELRHFIYKSRSTLQFTSPQICAPYVTPTQKERLHGLYLNIHGRMHSSARPIRIMYKVTQYESILGWVSLYRPSVKISQWENECIPLSILSVARVQFPSMAEYFKGPFPGWSYSTNPSWAGVAKTVSISPQWHHAACGHWEGRPAFNHCQTTAGKKPLQFFTKYCSSYLFADVLADLSTSRELFEKLILTLAPYLMRTNLILYILHGYFE